MSEAELEKLRYKMMLLYHFTLSYCFIVKGDL